MKKIMFAILAFVFASPAGALDMKSVSGVMYGDRMNVEYAVLNTGRHILVVKEFIGKNKQKSIFEHRQAVELDIKGQEVLASQVGFHCTVPVANKKTTAVYAVIDPAKAKEKESFTPERAWYINPKTIHLDPIQNPAEVSCVWKPEGSAEYPFRNNSAGSGAGTS